MVSHGKGTEMLGAEIGVSTQSPSRSKGSRFLYMLMVSGGLSALLIAVLTVAALLAAVIAPASSDTVIQVVSLSFAAIGGIQVGRASVQGERGEQSTL